MNKVEQKSIELSSHQEEYENLLPLHYTFKHEGLPFDCHIAHDDSATSIIVSLTANLGHLPYSAENMVRRMELLEVLNPLMARGQVNLDHHCNLTMPVSTSLSDELCARKLMEAVTYTLLDMRDIIQKIRTVIGTETKIPANA